MEKKESLSKKLLKGDITPVEFDELMDMLDKADFRNLIKRVFDLEKNETANNSTAEVGLLGFMNRVGKNIKNRGVKKKLNKAGYRNDKKLIIAEGDSWFEYPIFLKDIIDWIIKDTDNPVYSLAYGGDWIANIIYEEEYIIELTTYQPEVFLISGGGNDLVGDGRLGILINKPSMVDFSERPEDAELMKKIIAQNFDNGEIGAEGRAKMIVRETKYLNKDFWGLISTFEIMYKMVFKSIDVAGKFGDMKILTQGYDFAIPSNNTKLFVNPLRWMFGNGKWLYYPLVRKGVSDSYEQQCILSAMIYYFNEMLISVGKKCNERKGTNYVFHIDSRGALKKKDWADELHPFSKPFRKISEVYVHCINDVPSLDTENTFIYPVRKY